MTIDFELGELKLTFNPSQREFYEKVEQGRYCGFGGGYGNGKTLAACIQVLRMAASYPNNLILIGRLKGSDLENSTRKTFLELIGPWLESGQAQLKVKDNKVILENGTEIVFRHLEEVYSTGISGMNLGGFYVDQAEEIDEAVFDILTARLRRKSTDENGNEAPRFGILTFNMNGHNWIWRLFKKKLNKQKEPLSNPDDYTLVEASTVDNQAHLPEDYIADLLSKPKDWIARYVYGSWDVFSGQIFDEFNPEIHVIPHREPKQGSVLFVGIDPGYVDPFSVLWLAIEPGGQRYIWAEHYVVGQTTPWHAQVIRMVETGKHIMCRYTDAANAQVIADLNANGVYTVPAKKESLQSSVDFIGGGIQELKKLFMQDPVTKEPGVVISDRCVNFIYELQQYAWKPRKGEYNATEVPEDKNNHLIDCARYILINYFDTRTASGKRSSMASARDLFATH